MVCVQSTLWCVSVCLCSNYGCPDVRVCVVRASHPYSCLEKKNILLCHTVNLQKIAHKLKPIVLPSGRRHSECAALCARCVRRYDTLQRGACVWVCSVCISVCGCVCMRVCECVCVYVGWFHLRPHTCVCVCVFGLCTHVPMSLVCVRICVGMSAHVRMLCLHACVCVYHISDPLFLCCYCRSYSQNGESFF